MGFLENGVLRRSAMCAGESSKRGRRFATPAERRVLDAAPPRPVVACPVWTDRKTEDPGDAVLPTCVSSQQRPPKAVLPPLPTSYFAAASSGRSYCRAHACGGEACTRKQVCTATGPARRYRFSSGKLQKFCRRRRPSCLVSPTQAPAEGAGEEAAGEGAFLVSVQLGLSFAL